MGLEGGGAVVLLRRQRAAAQNLSSFVWHAYTFR